MSDLQLTHAVTGNGSTLEIAVTGRLAIDTAAELQSLLLDQIGPVSTVQMNLSAVDGIDLAGYIIAQILGALAGSGLLCLIFSLGKVTDKTGALGSNGTAGVNGSSAAAFITEFVLTFIFVIAILGVTSKKASHGSFGGLVIGLTLTFVHILGIGLTGTSVNPARSIGPAIVCAIQGNTAPVSSLWIFIVAPLAGAAIASIVYKFIESKKN